MIETLLITLVIGCSVLALAWRRALRRIRTLEKERAEAEPLYRKALQLLHDFRARFGSRPEDSDSSPLMKEVLKEFALIKDGISTINHPEVRKLYAEPHQAKVIELINELLVVWKELLSNSPNSILLDKKFATHTEVPIMQIPKLLADTMERFAGLPALSVSDDNQLIVSELIRWKPAILAMPHGAKRQNHDDCVLLKIDFRVLGSTQDSKIRIPLVFLLGVCNAAGNSRKYVPQVGGEIAVTIGVDFNNKMLTAIVSDNGPGVSYQMSKKLYNEKFVSKSGGFGSGAADIAREIRSLGGDIYIADNRSNFLLTPDTGMTTKIYTPFS